MKLIKLVVLVAVCWVALQSPVRAQSLDAQALEIISTGGERAMEISRDFRFSEAATVQLLVDETVLQISKEEPEPFLLNLVWSAVGGVERTALAETVKSTLIKRIIVALRARGEFDLELSADVLEFRFGLLNIDSLDFGNLSMGEKATLVEKLEYATFFAEYFARTQPNYPANLDFWDYQFKLRNLISAWRPENFVGPLVNLIDPASLSRPFRDGNGYYPQHEGTASIGRRAHRLIGDENGALRYTLVNSSSISNPEGDGSRGLARARLAYLAEILGTKKIVLPPTPLDAHGGDGTNMVWRIESYSHAGRCSPKSSSFDTDGVNTHTFGENCRYNGGDSTTTEVVGGIATGTDKFGPAGTNRRYWALASSFARGGFADRGDENQSARLRYLVRGKATVPPCNDPAFCAPILMIQAEVPERYFQDYEKSPPPQARATMKVDGKALALGEEVLVDVSRKPVELEIILERNFTHVGACCFPARGQSRASFVVQQLAAARLGLEGAEQHNSLSAPSLGRGSGMPAIGASREDLNRVQTQNLVDLLRAASGGRYQPDLQEAQYATLETRKSTFLGSNAKGGFIDDISTLLGALYLIHDFQATRPDDVPPHISTLVRLLQASLSNRARKEFQPQLEEAILQREQQLRLLSSSLFSQTVSEARRLLVANTLEREKLFGVLNDVVAVLDDPNLPPGSAGDLRNAVSLFQANSAENTLLLLSRLDGFTKELAAIRGRQIRDLAQLVKIRAQF